MKKKKKPSLDKLKGQAKEHLREHLRIGNEVSRQTKEADDFMKKHKISPEQMNRALMSSANRLQDELSTFTSNQNKSLGGHAEKGKKKRLEKFKKVRKDNPNATAKVLLSLCNKAGLEIKLSSVYSYLTQIGE